MQTAYFASLAALTLSFAACSGTNNATTSTSGTPTTSSSTSSGTGGSGGTIGTTTSEGGGGMGGRGLGCSLPFVTKGPWSLAVDATHAKVRWEACQSGAAADLHFTKEGGGPEQTATSKETAITLSQTYKAPLNIDAPPDYAGTYYTHEAALEKLEAGSCYSYALADDPSRKGRFCTSKPSGQDFKFLAIGDTNPGLGHSAGVLAHVLPENPEFTVHGGDLEYYDSGLETWASWFPVMQPMLSQGALFPAIGNHESEKSDELADYALRFFGGAGFDGGETYYRFEYGGVHFFSLNTQESIGQGSAQGTWLEGKLAQVAKEPGFRFSIVFFHRPLLTCGDNSDDPPARAYLEPIFLANKVALVLQAHMHGYERFQLDNGMTYITTAGGGGLLGNVDENKSRDYCDKRASAAAAYHALVLEVSGKKLLGKAIDEKGTVIDTFSKDVP